MVQITIEQQKLIEEHPVALSTVCKGNKPNVIGVAFVKVIEANKILITDNYMSHTKDNLEKNNNVCLAVWDKDWSGVKLIGTAEYFSEGNYVDVVKNIPENKNLSAKGAIVITVSQLIELK